MAYTIGEIADAIGAQVDGDRSLRIEALAEPASASASDLAMAMKPAYAEQLSAGQAKAALMWEGADRASFGLDAVITAPRPRFVLSSLSAMMDPGQGFAPGLHPSAHVDPSATLGEGVTLGPGTVVGPRARIGAGSVIGPMCFVGADVTLGEGAYLREHVSLGQGIHIGARFVAQPGARIGGDGFSFVTPEASGVEQMRETLGDQGELRTQTWARIHSLGRVEIGDDVEIGANSCIDNGTIRATRIGNGVKIDNLVQVGHNCEIGEDTLLCAQVGVAGSSKIGRNVVLGGQTGVSDNIFVGDNAITGGGTIVLSNVPSGQVMLGYPATKMASQLDTYKALRRLPRILRDVAALKREVFKGPGSD